MADKLLAQVAQWRGAHPEIEIKEEALLTMAPFASLYANDFLVYAEKKDLPPEAVQFLQDIARELVWAYDNWQKAQRDADQGRLFKDILNNARQGGGDDSPLYAQVSKFLKDYANANNIAIDARELTSWEATFEV